MRLVYILSFFVLVGCNSLKKLDGNESSAPKAKPSTVLTEDQQRQFDFSFYEAAREKMMGNYERSATHLARCLTIDPTSGAAMFELANIFIAGNEPVKAQGILERAVELNGDNIWYKLLLADMYQNNKMPVKAITLYEQFVKDYPTNEDYRFGLAQLYQTSGDYQNAINQYNKLEEIVGLNEIIVVEKKKIYLLQGKNKQALTELERLTTKFPDEARYYGFIADYYFYIKNYTTAKEYYNIVLNKDADNGLAMFSLGNLSLISQDTTSFVNYYNRALKTESVSLDVKLQRILPWLTDDAKLTQSKSFMPSFFESLIACDGNDSRAFIYYANYLKALENSELAIKMFAKSLALDPQNELVWQDYLLMIVSKQDFPLLVQEGKRAITEFPETGFFYLLTGSGFVQVKNYEEALSIFEKGLLFSEDNKALKSQLLANMGDAYYSLKKPDKAFDSYDKALLIDEFNIMVLNNYSYYLSLENKNLDKAERMSSKCVEMEPGNSTYLDTYAWVLFKRGRFFEAKYIIERAIDNGGTTSDVIVEHYGDILYKNGDLENALIQWKLALELGNTNELLPEKIKQNKYLD